MGKKAKRGSAGSDSSSAATPHEVFPFSYCIVATAVCLGLALSRPVSNVERPPHREYADFASFWPLYVNQHAKPVTKLLHALGTSLATVTVVPTHGVQTFLRLGLGIASGSALSLCAVDLTATQPTGLPEALVMVVLLVGAIRKFTGMSAGRILPQLASGYVFPWIAHFFVELNKPATFRHPTFSFIGDFTLLASLLTGRLALDASTV
jgi:hypothetical protein